MALDVAVQKQCSSSEYRDNLYPLLGLIFNISTVVTSPGLQVGHMLSEEENKQHLVALI